MSNVAMLARLLIGGFAYFVEEGKTIDAVVVGPTTAGKPDNVPTTNWPSLGCIEQLRLSAETVEETFVCPRAAGGYRRERERQVVFDQIALQLAEHNEFVHRLMWGVDAEIALDAAQTPFSREERSVKGWLKLQGRKKTGTDLAQADVWVKMMLNTAPPWAPQTGRPELTFDVLDPTSGATIVFPT